MVPSWPSFHRRSVLFIPEAKEPRTVPLGASDGERHLGEAVISLAIPGKAVGHHHHPLRLPDPLANQHLTWSKLGALLVKACQAGATLPACRLRVASCPKRAPRLTRVFCRSR